MILLPSIQEQTDLLAWAVHIQWTSYCIIMIVSYLASISIGVVNSSIMTLIQPLERDRDMNKDIISNSSCILMIFYVKCIIPLIQ